MRTSDDLRKKAMAVLDVGLIATFLWTCFSVWIAYEGPTIVSRSTSPGEAGSGWSRATFTVAEEAQVRSLLLYTLAIHAALWLAYWMVRRIERYAPSASDMSSLGIAALLTVCYIPAFAASWILDGTLIGLLWPSGFPTICSHLAYLEAMDRPFVYFSVALKVAVFLLPILLLVGSRRQVMIARRG